MSNHEQPTPNHPQSNVWNTVGKDKQTPQGSARTTSAVDLEEFCEKHYDKLLPILADKYEYEQRKKEKLEEVGKDNDKPSWGCRVDNYIRYRSRGILRDQAYETTRCQSWQVKYDVLVEQSKKEKLEEVKARLDLWFGNRSRSTAARPKNNEIKKRNVPLFMRLGSMRTEPCTSSTPIACQESSRYTKNSLLKAKYVNGHGMVKSRKDKSLYASKTTTSPNLGNIHVSRD
ncbi:hypothetical protein Tco_0575594 [Tanacetum coccineum]